MPGKTRLHKLLVLLALACCLWGHSVWAADPGGPVAILVSDSDEAYRKQAESFRDDVDLPAQVFNLQGDISADPALKDRIFAAKPVLIYALGAKAAYAAKLWTQNRQEIPVIFAMVLNWQRFNLLDGSTNMAGIAAEMPAGTQFINLSIFSPGVKRIGVVYSPYSTELLAQARKAAATLGLELVTEPVDSSKDLQRSFKVMEDSIDAFWVLSDPILYTLDNLDWLEDRCLKKRLLCVGQSQNLVKIGISLAVTPDFSQTSTQAAAMAKNILLHGQKPSEIKVMDPISTQILLNLKTAKRIGLSFSPEAMGMATTVITE